MKNKLLWAVLLLVTVLSQAQSNYKKIYPYDECHKDWAMVKTIAGTYGFIDRDGKVVVAPIYAKIEKFTQNSGQYAQVKSVAGTYGLIDSNGKEVIKAIYTQIEPFGELGKEVAIVKSVADTYGLVNKKGKEVIPSLCRTKEDVRQKYNAMNIQ